MSETTTVQKWWECRDCGFTFDAAHSDDTGTNGEVSYSCPECELARLRQQISGDAAAVELGRALLAERPEKSWLLPDLWWEVNNPEAGYDSWADLPGVEDLRISDAPIELTAARTFEQHWWVALIVIGWTDDGTIDEAQPRLFTSREAAVAARDAALASRPAQDRPSA